MLDYDVVLIRSTGPDTEEVLIDATVRMPSGTTQHKPLLVTLKRAKDGLRVTSVRVSTESASPGFQLQ